MKLKLGYEQKSIEISTIFIDHYMTTCPPVYSLIYIFAMKKLLSNESVSIDSIATHFNITQGDVKNAWAHWQSVGLISLGQDESITFLPVAKPVEPSLLEDIQAPIKAIAATRPQYTVEELAVYRTQNNDIARLFACAERTLGKLLYYNDMNIIFSFHDWLHLPIDVIEYLLSYCADNGHRSLRYIEKCALDWADNQITDLEKAMMYVQSFDKNYRTILHYMGQTSGYPTPSHRKYIDKWIDQWQMPLDLIMEACDRCVSQLNKPQFKYIDGILANWHKQEITDIAGVKTADMAFEKSMAASNVISIDKSPSKPKVNRFVNFTQRENDYSQLEKLERAYLEQKLQ